MIYNHLRPRQKRKTSSKVNRNTDARKAEKLRCPRQALTCRHFEEHNCYLNTKLALTKSFAYLIIFSKEGAIGPACNKSTLNRLLRVLPTRLADTWLCQYQSIYAVFLSTGLSGFRPRCYRIHQTVRCASVSCQYQPSKRVSSVETIFLLVPTRSTTRATKPTRVNL